ncbi:MAG TPA: hypothetical protein VNU70_14110 [Puia sp.]|jgi:hypothetical protein|nr:hypothetical protein [Puia sp.]
MKKFLVIYHAPMDSAAMAEMMKRSPEEMAKGMELWQQWAKKTGSHLVDLGSPLMGGQQLSLDGSFKPSSKQVCGYSILQAENMEEAKSLLEGHPHLGPWNPQATIEVHETMTIPGM